MRLREGAKDSSKLGSIFTRVVKVFAKDKLYKVKYAILTTILFAGFPVAGSLY